MGYEHFDSDTTTYDDRIQDWMLEDNGIDDVDDDSFVPLPQEQDEEEFYYVDERELSCCHEEWEDYC